VEQLSRDGVAMFGQPPRDVWTAALDLGCVDIAQPIERTGRDKLIAPAGRDCRMKANSETRVRELHRRGWGRG
jgi:hypothetical protein